MLQFYLKTLLLLPFLFIASLQAATPVHTLNGLVTNLSPDGTTEVPAALLVTNECAFEEILIIRSSLSNGNPPESSNTSIVLDCNDPQTLIIEIWGKDFVGNWSWAETYIVLEDNLEACPDGGGMDRPVAHLMQGLSYSRNIDDNIIVHVDDFVLGYDSSTGEPDFAFSPDPADTTLTFDCNGFDLELITIYALDGNPDPSFTNTYLTSESCAPSNSCCDESFSLYNGFVISLPETQQYTLKAADIVNTQPNNIDIQFSFSEDPADSLDVLDCNSSETELFTVWGISAGGATSLGVTYILVQDNNAECQEIYPGPENGNACNAYDITDQLENCYIYGNNIDAFTQSFEPSPPLGNCGVLNNWCYPPTHTVWYYFDAPASGSVNIYTELMGTQLALWEVDDCGALTSSNAILVTAISNDQNMPSSIEGLSCLIPGKRYYLAVDGLDGATGEFRLSIEDANITCLLGPNSTSCEAASTSSPEDATIGWQNFYTQSGELVGSIANYNNTLGEISFDYQYNDGPVRTDDLGVPYLDRNWAVSVESQPTTDVLLRLYFTEAEFQALRAASNDIQSLEDLHLTRLVDGQCGPFSEGETLIYDLVDVGSMSTAGNYFIDFEIPGFSSFYINAQDGLTISDTRSANLSSEVMLIPNPASDQLRIVLSEHQKKAFGLTISDMSGKIMINKKVSSGESISTVELSSGAYILMLQNEESYITQKLIIR